MQLTLNVLNDLYSEYHLYIRVVMEYVFALFE